MSAISHKKRKKTRKEIRQIKENPAEGFVVYWRALHDKWYVALKGDRTGHRIGSYHDTKGEAIAETHRLAKLKVSPPARS